MKKLPTLLALAALVLADARAQTVYTDLSSQPTGLVHFNSVTPRNRFELAHGTYEAQPTIIQGTLVLPKHGKPPYPAMVLSHGSGGIEPKDWGRWVLLFSDIGIASFVVDSFTTRHITSTVDDQSQLDQAANDADALSALKLLATDPRIDGKRIGVIGFSRGGVVALDTANNYFRQGIIKDSLQFAAHVAFYPGCGLRYWTKPQPMTGAPIMMALAGADNYTLPQPCVAYAKVLREAGQDVTLHVYANASHDFDSFVQRPVYHPKAQSARACPDREIDLATWEYRILKTGQRFQDLDQFTTAIGHCITTGATTGGNAAQAVRAEADVREFLTRVLQP